MKYIDREKGKIFGINLVDLVIGILALFMIFSFGSKILSEDLNFSGDEMYNAIQAFERFNNKGFLVYTEVEGRWIATGQEKKDSSIAFSGLITGTKSGAFLTKNEKGEYEWIGGSMAYMEDIAADKMVFKPLDNYVAKTYIPSMYFDSYGEMIDFLEDYKKSHGADHLMISADMGIINPTMSPIEMLSDYNSNFLIRNANLISVTENEVSLGFRIAELDGLKAVNPGGEKIFIGNINGIYLGFLEKPSLSEMESIEGFKYLADIEELK